MQGIILSSLLVVASFSLLLAQTSETLTSWGEGTTMDDQGAGSSSRPGDLLTPPRSIYLSGGSFVSRLAWQKWVRLCFFLFFPDAGKGSVMPSWRDNGGLTASPGTWCHNKALLWSTMGENVAPDQQQPLCGPQPREEWTSIRPSKGFFFLVLNLLFLFT